MRVYCVLFSAVLLVMTVSCQPNMYKQRSPDLAVGGDIHTYVVSLGPSDAFVLDGYSTLKAGGTLYCLEKRGTTWETAEKIELGDTMPLGYPVQIVSNENWLCISSMRVGTLQPDQLFFFKKTSDGWVNVQTPEPCKNIRFKDDNAFLDNDNRLYIGEPFPKPKSCAGRVVCIDLNLSPPQIIKTIYAPDRGEKRESPQGFGCYCSLNKNNLIVYDGGVRFAEEDDKKYGGLSPIYDAIPKDSFLVFSRVGDDWKYSCDLFDKLPHPQGKILREENAWPTSEADKFYHYLLRYESDFALFDHSVYLKTTDEFFKFVEKDRNWEFAERLKPPQLDFDKDIDSPLQYRTDNIKIGQLYSVGLRSDGYIEIYKTAELREFKPNWTIAFDERRVNAPLQKHSSLERCFHAAIEGNLVLAFMTFSFHDRDAKLYYSYGDVILYEVDEDTGPHEVFRFEQKRDKVMVPVQTRPIAHKR